MTYPTRLKLLGWAHAALAGAGLAFGAFVTLGVGFSNDPRAEETLGWVVPIFIAAQALWLLPGLVGGVGLAAGQPWGKGPVTFVSALMLTFVPVGTVLGGLSLWLLYSREARVAAASAVRQPMTNNMKLALCFIAAIAALGLMICLGYIFRDTVEDLPVPNRLTVVLSIAVASVIAVGVSMLFRGRSLTLNPMELQRRAKAQAQQKIVVAEHHARIAAMRLDPVLAPYAAKIDAGDFWTDEQIAYDLDPSRTATCEHLVAVERGIRAAGITIKPSMSPSHVDARCDIEDDRLRAAYDLSPYVSWSDTIEMGGRFYEDPPGAALRCSACNSGIWSISKSDVKPDTPVFPPRRS